MSELDSFARMQENNISGLPPNVQVKPLDAPQQTETGLQLGTLRLKVVDLGATVGAQE